MSYKFRKTMPEVENYITVVAGGVNDSLQQCREVAIDMAEHVVFLQNGTLLDKFYQKLPEKAFKGALRKQFRDAMVAILPVTYTEEKGFRFSVDKAMKIEGLSLTKPENGVHFSDQDKAALAMACVVMLSKFSWTEYKPDAENKGTSAKEPMTKEKAAKRIETLRKQCAEAGIDLVPTSVVDSGTIDKATTSQFSEFGVHLELFRSLYKKLTTNDANARRLLITLQAECAADADEAMADDASNG